MTNQEKIELLKVMHTVMLGTNDENCYDQWTLLGVPDAPREEDFEYIANNKEDFIYVVNLFCNLVHDFF